MENALNDQMSSRERGTVDVSPRVNGRSLALLTGLVLLAALALWMVFARGSSGAAPGPTDLARLTFEEQTGVRILRVAVTAGGGMLDLRYQILDPDKAVIVHDEETPPTLIDEASGTAISTTWHEHDSSADLHTAVTYYELIMNPDGILKRGSRVTVRVGEAELAHVPVE